MNAGSWLLAQVPASAWSALGALCSTVLVSVVVPLAVAWLQERIRAKTREAMLRQEIDALRGQLCEHAGTCVHRTMMQQP